MVRVPELRQRIAALVNGEVSLDDFEDWFAAASWNAHLDSSPEAQRLVGAVELRLSELSSDHLSFREFLEELEALVRSERVVFTFSVNTTVPLAITIDAVVRPFSKLIKILNATGGLKSFGR